MGKRAEFRAHNPESLLQAASGRIVRPGLIVPQRQSDRSHRGVWQRGFEARALALVNRAESVLLYPALHSGVGAVQYWLSQRNPADHPERRLTCGYDFWLAQATNLASGRGR